MPAPSPPEIVASRSELRPGDPEPLIVVDALREILDAHGLGTGPVDVQLIGDGQSNVTAAVRRGDQAWALRRPPRPPWPPSAFNVLREHRILTAVDGTGVRAPRPVLACEDTTVLGAPFYLMELVDGAVITTVLPAALDTPGDRQRIGEEMVDALAELHAVDVTGPAFARLGRPAGYLERQLRRFGELWPTYRFRPLPEVEEAERRLRERVPASGAPALVHGDYRLGNVIFAPDAPARLVAMLDWEMATVGDPLADLGYLTINWAEPGDRAGSLLELGAATAAPGFVTRSEIVERYVAQTGRDAGRHAWYEALAYWKGAVMLENLHRRGLESDTSDAWVLGLQEGVPDLAARAIAALDRDR